MQKNLVESFDEVLKSAIEIDSYPAGKPIVVSKRGEFLKLVQEAKEENGLILRFNKSVYVLWRGTIFLHVIW